MTISEPKQKVRQALLDAGVNEVLANTIITADPDKFHFRDVRDIAEFFDIPSEYQWQDKQATMIRPAQMQRHYNPPRNNYKASDSWMASNKPEVIFEHLTWDRLFMLSLKPADDKQREIVEILQKNYAG